MRERDIDTENRTPLKNIIDLFGVTKGVGCRATIRSYFYTVKREIERENGEPLGVKVDDGWKKAGVLLTEDEVELLVSRVESKLKRSKYGRK